MFNKECISFLGMFIQSVVAKHVMKAKEKGQ